MGILEERNGLQAMLLDETQSEDKLWKLKVNAEVKMEPVELQLAEVHAMPTIPSDPLDLEKEEDPNNWISEEAEKPIDKLTAEKKLDEEPPIRSAADTFDGSPICRPSKRLRVEVLVSPLSHIQKKWKEELQEDFKKLKGMKDPKVKKIANMELSLDTVHDRLKPIGLELFDITLNKADQEAMVTRRFMSSTYGGSSQSTFPNIGARFLAQHGMDDFGYMNIDYQIHAPQVPGAPGLFFGCHIADRDFDGLKRVLTRIQPSLWKYMGQYEIKRSYRPALTKEEWASQKNKFRKTWASEICRQNWGTDVQARIRARVVFKRRHPTVEQINEMISSKQYKKTTPEEVERAFNKGEEVIGVWTMKCHEYDNTFQLQLCEKFPPWLESELEKKKEKEKEEEEEEEEKKKREQGASSPAKVSKAMVRKPKRKHSETLEKDEDGFGSHQELELYYKSKGTRSRPIVL